MKDRCILWGAGKIGQSIISTINTIYEIYAFCDNEKLKWGGGNWKYSNYKPR